MHMAVKFFIILWEIFILYWKKRFFFLIFQYRRWLSVIHKSNWNSIIYVKLTNFILFSINFIRNSCKYFWIFWKVLERSSIYAKNEDCFSFKILFYTLPIKYCIFYSCVGNSFRNYIEYFVVRIKIWIKFLKERENEEFLTANVKVHLGYTSMVVS